jgi:hypothetical protein
MRRVLTGAALKKKLLELAEAVPLAPMPATQEASLGPQLHT